MDVFVDEVEISSGCMEGSDRRVALVALAAYRVGRTVASPTSDRESGAGIADDGGAVGLDVAAGDDLEASGVVVEAQKIRHGAGGQGAHVRVFDLDGRAERGAAGLQGPGKGGICTIRNGHRYFIVVNLVE